MSQNENILLNSNLEAFDVDFSKLTVDSFNEAYEFFLHKAENEFNATLKNKNPTYKDLFQDGASQKLMALHHLLGSLNMLVENEEFRKIEEKYSGILTLKFTQWSLNSKIFKKIEDLTKTKEYACLSDLRKKMIQKTLKDLKSSGVNLPAKEKKQLAKINQKIAKLTQKFQNNITDAQDQLSFIVKEKDLKGLSEQSMSNVMELTKSMGLKDGTYFIDQPSGLIDDVMAYGESESIRKKLYLKRRNLATKGKYNNTELINQIYKLNQEVASLLGYKNYAHMALEIKWQKLLRRL